MQTVIVSFHCCLFLYSQLYYLLVMLEASAECVTQQDLMKAIKEGTKHTQTIIQHIEQLQQQIGKPKRELPPVLECSPEVLDAIRR